MLSLLLAALAAGAPGDGLAEARHAIEVGRLDQARTMIGAAIASGQRGEPIDRLMADLSFASGNNADALARYLALLVIHSDDPLLLERAAISAAKLGNATQAQSLADRAVLAPSPSWRVWNLLGVLADGRGDFGSADEYYRKALAAAPDQPELLNNIGWSHLLRGDWAGAVPSLERAVQIDRNLKRAANNLELATAGLSDNLPSRNVGESDTAWSARLNDAGIAAQIRGEQSKAVAAFTQALEARAVWYERAANNLNAVEARQ